MNFKKEKCLIADFSHSGKNYISGKDEDVPIGNTAVVAQMICDMTGGDLFTINTVTPYPAGYAETTEVAKKEKRENARPPLSSRVENMDSYSVIFLGYPNWWGTMPMAVCTFLESHDFTGKIIIPFCTHGGGGFGQSEKDIAQLCPKATVLNGLAIHGSRVKTAQQELADWLNRIVR